MSKHMKPPEVSSSFAGKYDVNDLIFKFNCAKHFSISTPKTLNGKDKEYKKEGITTTAAARYDRKEEEVPSQRHILVKSVKEEAPHKSTEISQTKVTGAVEGKKEEEKRAHLAGATVKVPVPPPPAALKVIRIQQVSVDPSATAIVLAVDATPTRVGGLLRLPGRESTIFYYSIDWTKRIEIDDSTKFEMINAALALELFDPYLKAYRPRYDNFIVKTDSHFYESIKGFKDPFDFEFLIRVRDKVKSFQGKFQHAVVSQKDVDIQNADYLSRTELPLGLKISYNDNIDYALVDLSLVASNYTLDVISEAVPGKYIKGYNYA